MNLKKPEKYRRKGGDYLFKSIALSCALVVPLIMGGIIAELWTNSAISRSEFGLGFLTSQAWNPVTQEFGALPAIFGTVVSTIIAMLLAVPLGLVIAIFLVELAPPKISAFFGGAVELLAAIPSIIYGMWGLFIFAALMADHVQPFLGKTLGFLPLFQGPPMGIGMLTAGIILALMILPYITSVSRDVFKMVPPVVKEAAYGQGATTWEVTRAVVVRYSMRGIIGAGFLGLGRALGETMAVTFVIGNSHRISASLFASSNSIASTLANEFTEAVENIYMSSLIELGLVLFFITIGFQFLAQLWLWFNRKKLAN